MNKILHNVSQCRCCLSNNWYTDLNDDYVNDGCMEIYSNMLVEVLNVKIVKHETIKNYICKECITRLHDAADFKSQVLNSEIAFQQYLDSNQQEVSDRKPVKSKNYKGDYIDYNVKINDGRLVEPDHDWCTLEDSKVEDQPMNLKMEKNSKNLLRNDNVRRQLTRKCVSKSNSIAKSIAKNIMKGVSKAKFTKAIPSRRKKSTASTERQTAQKQNTLKLILNSNMLMFISYKTKFGCFSCKERFVNIRDLRDHVKTHSTEKNIIARVKQMRGMSCKNVDISNLTCKLCSGGAILNLINLTDLQQHLTVAHNIVFQGTDHFLVPYKLEKGLECVICGQSFNTFLRLAVHMNTHSTNNVCEICGGSFVNRLSLRNHIHALHEENKCTQCSLTFASSAARKKHMIKIHNKGNLKRYYCKFCEKTFVYTYLLKDHNVKEHGEKPETSSLCVHCGKSFPSLNNLKVHIRAVHVKERNFPCDVCEMSFFTKHDLKRHERKHEDVKSYSCSYCDVRFKTKDSLRRHLKRQHT